MNNADFLEAHKDQMVYDYESYVFDGKTLNLTESENQLLIDFVKFCKEKADEALHIPRGKDGLSFFQQREKDGNS